MRRVVLQIEAKAQVKKCEDELKQIRRAVSELMARQGHDSDGEHNSEPDTEMQDAEGAGAAQPGVKRLRKKSGVGTGLDSLSSGESDDEKTLINRKRTIAVTSDDEDNSSSLVIRCVSFITLIVVLAARDTNNASSSEHYSSVLAGIYDLRLLCPGSVRVEFDSLFQHVSLWKCKILSCQSCFVAT